MQKSFFAAIAALALAACGDASTPSGSETGPKIARNDEPGLTQQYAEFRAGQVSNVRYQLDVQLDPSLSYFSGENTLRFDLPMQASDVTIDFADGKVLGINANGAGIEVDYNDSFITVPGSALKPGENQVTIRFDHSWSNDGSGLYRYDDTDDGNTYLYTDFEPYDANRAFPLFDQPDIKGRFTLSVTAPEDWAVVSTGREVSTEQVNSVARAWQFPETPPIPSYIMSLHAGPYAVWEDNDYRIPLRLFSRQSMAEVVAADAAMWFEYTRAGFDYFEDYFGVDYPYSKYDQLIVPDFNSGAMENAAAVTFNERSYIQRDGWSGKEEKRLAGVIFHEMAHMWFGNLVTMKWWNGLWLNETFASFMGNHASAAGLETDDAWESFFLDRKYAAYWTDRRSTTHPVETAVGNTDAIFSSFDSISYAKGASVLRQIEFRLGDEVFRRGVSEYLKRHAEGNTTLQDFVDALADASATDLAGWANEWLYTAGVNTVEAKFSCNENRITDFVLSQSAPSDFPVLRTQKVQIGLLKDVGGVVTTDAVIPVTYSGGSTSVPEAIGKICPDLVYPNHGDYGYLLVKLDPRTRTNLAAMIGRIEDPFQRVMFWQTLWDNVRFAQIPVTDYLDAVFASASQEDNLNNVDQIYAFVGTAIQYLRDMRGTGAALLDEYRPKAEAITWANVERTRGDLQTMYLDRYLSFVSGTAELERLVGLLDGNITIPGRELDQDRRWTMIRVLSSEGDGRASGLSQAELKKDPSDDGRRWALRVESAWPDLEVKRRIIDDVLNVESANPYALQRIAMGSAFPPGQKQLHEAFADEILAQVLENERNPDPSYYSRARGFAAYLIPTSCTEASVERLESAVAAHKDSRASIKRYVIERYEDDALCVQRAALLN